MTAEAARAAAAAQEFRFRFGRRAEGVWAAPGRVNLIGEHTDYNDGFVLPVAIDRTTVVAAARRPDGRVRGWSAQLGSGPGVALDELPGAQVPGWISYAAGVAWALREKGLPVEGLDVVVDSDVPVGAGLSSSAALSCAVALALADLAGVDVDRLDLAWAAQRAEREVVGAPVGIMDQAVSLLAREGHALFLDCRSLVPQDVPLPTAEATLVVVDTTVTHAHASGGYGTRRRECFEAAAALGVPALRDAAEEDLRRLPPVLARRARHVLSENGRVHAAVEFLRAGRVADLGPLLTASHASLRDDFAVSTPELDVAAAAAVDAGAYGARLTGGGFGGAVLAVAPQGAVPEIRRRVHVASGGRGFPDPTVFEVRPSRGAYRVADA